MGPTIASHTALLAAGLCAFLSLGCNTFGFDVRSFPNPVIVSPVLRVGDAEPTELAAPPIGHVRGEAKTSSASGASTHYEERGGDIYRVEESAYASDMSDDVFQSLASATGGRRDVFVVVDELKACDLTHMSLFGYAAMKLSVDGHIYERRALEPPEQGR